MSKIKVLKQGSEVFNKLESISVFLENEGIKIRQTQYKGLIFEIENNFFRYNSEGENTDVLPPFFDGRYILCDINGNYI